MGAAADEMLSGQQAKSNIQRQVLVRVIITGGTMSDAYRIAYGESDITDRKAQKKCRDVLARAARDGDVETVLSEFGLGRDTVARKVKEFVDAGRIEHVWDEEAGKALLVAVPDYRTQLSGVEMLMKMLRMHKPELIIRPGPFSGMSAENFENLLVEEDGGGDVDKQYLAQDDEPEDDDIGKTDTQ